VHCLLGMVKADRQIVVCFFVWILPDSVSLQSLADSPSKSTRIWLPNSRWRLMHHVVTRITQKQDNQNSKLERHLEFIQGQVLKYHRFPVGFCIRIWRCQHKIKKVVSLSPSPPYFPNHPSTWHNHQCRTNKAVYKPKPLNMCSEEQTDPFRLGYSGSQINRELCKMATNHFFPLTYTCQMWYCRRQCQRIQSRSRSRTDVFRGEGGRIALPSRPWNLTMWFVWSNSAFWLRYKWFSSFSTHCHKKIIFVTFSIKKKKKNLWLA